MKDIHGPALAIVLERLKQYGAFQETFELAKEISTGLTSKSSSKVGKSSSNGHGDCLPKHGSRPVSSRIVSTKVSRPESIMSVHDITIQSQALLNVKDSSKADRERLVVRKFKFEEPRFEQIHDLENDLMKYFREDLHRRLLSTDFKKQIDGIEMLYKVLFCVTHLW
ncbi:protein MOR1-like [Camellia sinensis]|uniref:protein MOR1-like n=1 Tax=Camellia sinensis TaxID=4442 RepID=UPI001035EC55|nr:protein MOR1-like [Camellia sinensis]